jgi:hypothetical protein
MPGLSLLIWHKKMLYDEERDADHEQQQQHRSITEKFSKLGTGLKSMMTSKK